MVTFRLGRVGNKLTSDAGIRQMRAHANRLSTLHDLIVQSNEPVDGVFPDSVRMLSKITESMIVKVKDGDGTQRWFKVQIGERRLSHWTLEKDLSEMVV